MKVIIYGKNGCTNCVKAKQYCQTRNIDFEYKEVGSDITKEQLEETIGHEIKSVPQIFVYSDGFSEYVGGYANMVSRLT